MIAAMPCSLTAVRGCLAVIDTLENFIIERLTNGLGDLVYQVASYGGELDGDIVNTIRRLPACWVTFGGSSITGKGTAIRRHQSAGKFVVMVATRSLRSEAASRKGGVNRREIGTYQLLQAVRRLLDGQGVSLGLTYGLQPEQIRTIFNHQNVGGSPLSVFAVEYTAVWNDTPPLDEGRYPLETDNSDDPDYVFTQYGGRLSPDYPELQQVAGTLFDPTTTAGNPINIYLRGQDEN